jgi:hypothetical protein
VPLWLLLGFNIQGNSNTSPKCHFYVIFFFVLSISLPSSSTESSNYEFIFFIKVINEIALKKCKGAPKYTGVYKKDTKTKEKQKTKNETRKNPRNATLNPQSLASNPTRTHTPSIKIDRAF